MYFHPFDYRSDVVNTDVSGFRFSEVGQNKYSVCNVESGQATRILAGSSTVFGIGASSDKFTLSSCMSRNDERGDLWLNFGGRSFNSTQEFILFSLNRHKLEHVKEIVLFSGFNDLGLARVQSSMRMEHGAFFMFHDFFEGMKKKRTFSLKGKLWRNQSQSQEPVPSVEEQIEHASALTTRQLANWKALANDMGIKLTFVLQPLANWVRSEFSEEETLIFSELEEKGGFEEFYGDILSKDVCQRYATKIQQKAEELGVRFINISPLLSAEVTDKDWLFVDRIHFNDFGHDVVSKILLTELTKDKG